MDVETIAIECLRCKQKVDAQIYLARDGRCRGGFTCPICKYVADPSWANGDTPQNVKDRLLDPPPFYGAFQINAGEMVEWTTRHRNKDYPKRGKVIAALPPFVDAISVIDGGVIEKYWSKFHPVSRNVRYLIRVHRENCPPLYYCPTLEKLEGDTGRSCVVGKG